MRAAAIAAALLAACSSAPAPRPELDHGLLATVDPAGFPGAKALLDGFDPPAAAADHAFRVGDSVLFALAVHDGERTERRLLRLRVLGLAQVLRGELPDGVTFAARVDRTISVTLTDHDGNAVEHHVLATPLTVELAQFAADGAPVRVSTVTLFEELLGTGLCALGGSDAEATVRAVCLLLSLQDLGAKDPVLADLLFAIADRPGLLSVALHLGVAVHLEAGTTTPWRGALGDDGAGERQALQLDVAVNGASSLWSDLVVGASRPPFALCAGVLGAIARHATDPQRYAVLRLLAARRGPTPAAPADGPAAK